MDAERFNFVSSEEHFKFDDNSSHNKYGKSAFIKVLQEASDTVLKNRECHMMIFTMSRSKEDEDFQIELHLASTGQADQKTIVDEIRFSLDHTLEGDDDN